MFKLKNTAWPHTEYPLKTGAYRIGSASDAELVIEDPSVALYHCEIVVTAKTISIRDLSSNHETYIDEQQTQHAQLSLGQTLRLGTVNLRLEDEKAGALAAEGAHGQTTAASVVEAAKRSLQPFAAGALVTLGIIAIGVMIYKNASSTTSDPRAPTPAGAAKNPPAESRKKEARPAEPAAPEKTRSPAPAGRNTAAPPRPAAPLRVQTNAAAIGLVAQTNALAAEAPPAEEVFDPGDINRPPNLDLASAESAMNAGNPAKAAPFLQRALANEQKEVGLDHPKVTPTLNALGEVYRKTRQPKKAAPYLEQALRNTEKAHGSETPETAAALNRLGEAYLAAGQPAAAAPLLERALSIHEKTPSSDAAGLLTSLKNVARVKVAQGEPAQARPLLQRAAKALDSGAPKSDAEKAEALDELGELNRATGDHEKAEPLLKQALDLKEKSLGPEDPSLAGTLSSLAAIQAAKGNLAEADSLYQRAENIAEKSLGSDHPEVAKNAKARGAVQKKMGNQEKAKELLLRAEGINEKSLGSDHPQTAASLGDRAAMSACEETRGGTRSIFWQAVRAKFRALGSILACAPQQHRLFYGRLLNPCDLAAASGVSSDIALAVLRYKGTVLDSLFEDRLVEKAALNPANQGTVELLRAAKEELARLLYEIPEDLTPATQARRQGHINGVARKIESIEAALEPQVPAAGQTRRALRTGLPELEQAIPESAALVEFVRYQRCVDADRWEPCYGAVVLSSRSDPAWILLGPALAIEKNIEQFHRTLRQSPSTAANATNEASLPSLLQTLYRQLWAPIAPSIGESTKTVIISPDGAIGLISFATLLTPDDRFLAQNYLIRYVSSGRDLLLEKQSSQRGAVVMFGNRNFAERSLPAPNGEPAAATAERDLDALDLKSLNAPPLPEAAREVALLEAWFRRQEKTTVIFFGANATEAQIKKVDRPRLLHLATRGFFLADRGADSPSQNEEGDPKLLQQLEAVDLGRLGIGGANSLPAPPARLQNPLRRAGLFMAGAQASLEAWQRGEITDPETDGILTAEDVSTLKLEGTELVFISATDGGTEAQRSGEELLGLRRAFVLAGAENLVMALWSVGHSETPQMLADFYERLQEKRDVAATLAETQRAWLSRLRNERNLEAAVRIAGAFVLSSAL